MYGSEFVMERDGTTAFLPEAGRDVILAVNPGGGSTKLGLFAYTSSVELLWTETIRHAHNDVSRYPTVLDQFEWRKDLTLDACDRRGLPWDRLAAVAGRGGPLKPLPGGVYTVDQAMLDDIYRGNVQAEHPSTLGALIAVDLARRVNVPAFIVDPPCVDELLPEARISGHPEIRRRSLTHALNIRDMCKRFAAARGCRYESLRLVVCHLGSGISVTAHRAGQMIDVTDSSGEGPFGPQRCGGLPSRGLARLCFAPDATLEKIDQHLIRGGGLVAYTGTDDFQVLLDRAYGGDEHAMLLYQAMVLQIKKEIGAYAAVLDGRVDAVLIGGALLHAPQLAADLSAGLSWIAEVVLYPGDDELGALARGVARVLTGDERVRDYGTSAVTLPKCEGRAESGA